MVQCCSKLAIPAVGKQANLQPSTSHTQRYYFSLKIPANKSLYDKFLFTFDMTTPASPQPPTDATAIDQLPVPTSPLTSPPSTIVPSSPSLVNLSSPLPHIEDECSYDPMSEGEEVDDSNDALNSTESTHLPQRRRYRSRQQKLNIMINSLRQVGWTYEEFTLAWAGFDGDQDTQVFYAVSV